MQPRPSTLQLCDKPELEDCVVCPSLLTIPKEAGCALTSVHQSSLLLKVPHFHDEESKP